MAVQEMPLADDIAMNAGPPGVAARREPKLTIVIPALNEEESIASTVERCLEAGPHIVRDGGVRDVEVIVVNDGSTDRTSEIAHAIAERNDGVSVIDFPKNRGYGAALKEGFEQGTGELVSFLDADGTCDPNFFADMCATMQRESASIVLGSRMGADSEMPRTRRIGNRLFAVLLGFLSGKAVRDTASGMRVIRREALRRLYPLPDGLQFTPAMSARAILDDIKIVEVNMTYSERVGESKLHAFRDGLRFLAAILSALLLFRPSRLFNLAGLACFIVAVALGLYPLEFYLSNFHLEESMFYRILCAIFLLTCCFVFVSSGVLANQLVVLVHRRGSGSFVDDVLAQLFSPKMLIAAAVLATAGSIFLIGPGLFEYLQNRETELHWSRAMVGLFLLQIALGAVVTAVLQWVVRLWQRQSQFEQ